MLYCRVSDPGYQRAWGLADCSVVVFQILITRYEMCSVVFQILVTRCEVCVVSCFRSR